MQDTEAVPEPETVPGLGELQDNPAELETAIDIVPENPFRAVSVTVDAVEEPGDTAEGEDALRVKSWNVNVTVLE